MEPGGTPAAILGREDGSEAQSLLSLHPPCLDAVLGLLQLRERLQLACVCRQLRDHVNGASVLWQDVELVEAGPRRLGAFLHWAAPRSAGMRRLSVMLRGQEDAPGPLANLGQQLQHHQQQQHVNGSGGLAPPPPPSEAPELCYSALPQLSSLVSLSLALGEGPLALGEWALPLARLRHLALASPELTLSDAGAALTSLTCLALSGVVPPPPARRATLHASDRCLPASLRALYLQDLTMPQLPGLAAESGGSCPRQLELLALRCVHRSVMGVVKAPVDFSVLSRLTALTALALEDVGLRAGQLPPAVTCLQRLERLAVQTGIEATQEEPFALLSAFAGPSAALTSLELSDCMLARFPSAVTELTQLRQLSIAGNAFCDLPLGLTALQQLRRLACSDRQALEWPGLPALPQLEAVWVAADKQAAGPHPGMHPGMQLHGPMMGGGGAMHMGGAMLPGQGLTGKQLRRLLRERLLPLPQLQELYCSCWPLRVTLDEWLHGPEAAWVRRVWRQPEQEWPHSDWEPPAWQGVVEVAPGEVG